MKNNFFVPKIEDFHKIFTIYIYRGIFYACCRNAEKSIDQLTSIKRAFQHLNK